MTRIRHYARTARRYLRNTKAVSALEYAMLVGAVAAGIGAAIFTFRQEIVESLTTLRNDMAAGVTAARGPGASN